MNWKSFLKQKCIGNNLTIKNHRKYSPKKCIRNDFTKKMH